MTDCELKEGANVFSIDNEPDLDNDLECNSSDEEVLLPDLFTQITSSGVLIHYNGEEDIGDIPTRCQIVEDTGAKLSLTIQQHVEKNKPIFFMPNDIEESNEYSANCPVYVLRIFGALMDGSKADVLITGIEIFFDVSVDLQFKFFDVMLKQVLADAEVVASRIENIEAYPIRGYNTSPRPYRRVYTSSTQLRKKAIAAVRASGMTTASDDRTCYYRKAAREYGLPLSDWSILNNYEYTLGPTEKSPLCDHIFRINVKNYKPLIDTMASKEVRELATQKKMKNAFLVKDRTLVVAWDIETYSGRGEGDLPMAHNDEDNCFMISLTAHWKDDPVALKQICIVDVETAPNPEWITIVCGSPTNILKAFALCVRAFAPDIMIGFNDSNYDWPFIVTKANKLKILSWMFDKMTAAPRKSTTDKTIMSYNYCHDKKIKISSEEIFYSSYLKVPGCVPIDVRVCFKKLYPKSETAKAGSLKFYLEISGLSGKADLPITIMWKYYKDALDLARPRPDLDLERPRPDLDLALPDLDLARPDLDTLGTRHVDVEKIKENMCQVSRYCVIDAVRCQQLLVRRNVINDYREVSSLAFVSIFDSHYYANGMKVCNLLGAYAWRRNILVSMIPLEREETGKYPGAYVFPPEKGICPNPERLINVENAIKNAKDANSLHSGPAGQAITDAFDALVSDRPVAGLDFSSLYPSLIMAYNLSPEKILLTEDEKEYWEKQNHKLHKIEFPFNGRTVIGWSIRHENIPDNIGLYPAVLIDLFAKRAEMKVILGKHGSAKELFEISFGRAKKDNLSNYEALKILLNESSKSSKVAELEKILAVVSNDDQLNIEYERVCFEWTCANTKQNALKVYMNTFYGEAGNTLSPFFMLQLAGGVTSAGQYNIKLVADFVLSKGFRIKYGDTDSLYLVAPPKYFKECDIDFINGKFNREEWLTAMVSITMIAFNQIRDDVNAYLHADNGSKYLKMAYEEVLYPVVFTGKKKYFGIPHQNDINFRPKNLFIRGIDVVKQGQPGLARDIGYRIMWNCMSIDNRRSMRQIVDDVLSDAVLNTSQWGFNHFIKSDAWKPNKNNIAVHRFIARMKSRAAMEVVNTHLYELPEAGERFSYVIVKTGAMFDINGCKITLKKGDRMEFARVAQANNLEIDVAFYMISYVIGLCARFINGETIFQVAAAAQSTIEKKIDELSQKAAKKSLEIFINTQQKGLDPATLRKRGYAYRRAFTNAAAATRESLIDCIGHTATEILHGKWMNFRNFENDEDECDNTSKIVESVWSTANNLAQSIIVAVPVPVHELKKASAKITVKNQIRRRPQISIIAQLQASVLGRIEVEVRAKLASMIVVVTEIATRYETDISNMVFKCRIDEHNTHPEIGVSVSTIDHPLQFHGSINESDRNVLLKFREVWFDSVGLQLIRDRRA